MNKLSKRAISIIVIATFLLSMIPIMPANAILNTVNLSVSSGDKGDTVTVSGAVGEVTSGATVEIYWDTAIGINAYLLNSTTGKADGSWEVNFDVPEAVTGEHYVWAKDGSGPYYASEKFTVISLVKLSPDSGLVDDEVTVTGYGFAADDDIGVFWATSPVTFYEVDDATAGWVADTTYGAYAVELTADTDLTIYSHADVAMAGNDLPVSIVDFSDVVGATSYLWYRTGATDSYGPHICFYLTNGTGGFADITMMTNTAISASWTSLQLSAVQFHYFGNENSLAAQQGPGFANTLVHWQGTALATWTIYKVQVEEGWWSAGSGTAVVDNLVINGVAYDWEPSIVDTTTDEFGSFDVKFDVPTGASFDDYIVSAIDHGPTMNFDTYTVGASFTMTPEEGPTGTVISVEGRGWSKGGTMTFEIPGPVTLAAVDGDPIVTESDGTFSAELVMPNVASVTDYTITATETNTTTNVASEDFDVTGLPKITLSPGFGPPGETVSIEGYNFTQVSGTVVDLDFGTLTGIKTFTTDANGEFSGTFTAQALAFSPPDHDVTATDEFGVSDDAKFRLGMMIIIISPTYGPSGDYVYLTGTGFEASGDWNATLDGDLIAEGTASTEGVIATYFYVPSIEAGTYNLEVLDITSEIALSTIFIVTETTYVTVSPSQAPSSYNVSIEGFNFADTPGAVTFELYNSTNDWTLTVLDEGSAVQTDLDGNFTGTFLVPTDISLGDYLINVTDSMDLFAQIPFSVVAARVDVTPRKALFDRGNSITFDISNDFDLPDSYIEIYSPDDILYWITDDLTADMWVLVDELYTVPYYRQTANLNPMDLASDAPLGTWTYFFYDESDEELMNGTFAVGPSTAAQVDALLEDVRSDLSGLAEDMAGLSDDFADDMDALSADFADDIASLSADFAYDIDGLSDEIAGATDAGNAASAAVADLEDSLSDLEDSMGDIADASNSALDAAQEAADAAADAATAAEGAGDAAKGLTSLVYGAIGASLIAALAAIVSLMQISKKIAG